MASHIQRFAVFVGLGKPDPDEHDPRDERTLLQILIGNLLFGAVAAVVSKLLGSDVVESVMFGVIIYILFLWLDLRARRKHREGEGGPPPAV